MAEQQESKDVTCQDLFISGPNAKNKNTQPVNEFEPADPCLDGKHQCSDDATLSSTPANEAPTNNCGEALVQVVNSEEDKSYENANFAEGDHLQNTVNNDLAESETHGGYKGDSTKNEKTETIPEKDSCSTGEDPTTNKPDVEAAILQIPASGEVEVEEEEEEVDGPKVEISEKSPAATNSDTETEEDGLNALESEEEINVQKKQVLPQKQTVPVVKESNVKENYVETIGPSTIEASDAAISEAERIYGGNTVLKAAGIVGIIVAILMYYPISPPPKTALSQIDIFINEMDKVQTQYPNQRSELWNRSRIHLKRHLQTSQPTEPVSLILTAGLRAERTLHCLAQSVAYAFSSALNASVLHIDGVSKARQDSDQVKLDIDRKLQGAFEGDKPVAVIHRFEELPPGSTLIFYRYCDHENAAYKKTFLIFTVLLDEEEEIPAETRLSAVEEMVDDHLQKKFLSHGPPASFDRMDYDKYGGLWSRISHLILPVTAEKRNEHEGC